MNDTPLKSEQSSTDGGTSGDSEMVSSFYYSCAHVCHYSAVDDECTLFFDQSIVQHMLAIRPNSKGKYCKI